VTLNSKPLGPISTLRLNAFSIAEMPSGEGIVGTCCPGAFAWLVDMDEDAIPPPPPPPGTVGFSVGFSAWFSSAGKPGTASIVTFRKMCDALYILSRYLPQSERLGA
jgi:hypothetical protein